MPAARRVPRQQRKLYLSDEAYELLQAEAERTTYPASILVDQMIKKALAPKPERKPRPRGYQFNG